MADLLVVDDDLQLCTKLKFWLEQEHHVVTCAHTCSGGKDQLISNDYDVIILDLGLPDSDGLELCKWFRDQGGSTPILLLTGRAELEDKEIGLDSGADDYLTKPFDQREVAARLRALLRRPQQLLGTQLKVGDVELDSVERKASKGGVPIKLTVNEFALLEFLMRHVNRVYSVESLINRVWKADSAVGSESVRTNIKRLRQEIDSPGQISRIENVYGVGYRMRYLDSDQ